jgi:hypothetical protein
MERLRGVEVVSAQSSRTRRGTESRATGPTGSLQQRLRHAAHQVEDVTILTVQALLLLAGRRRSVDPAVAHHDSRDLHSVGCASRRSVDGRRRWMFQHDEEET